MAFKGRAYGLSRACNIKTMAKFDRERAMKALAWVEEVIERELEPRSNGIKDHFDVRSALRDGVALCQLINVLRPGAVKKIHKSNLAFKQMENIEMFLRACREYGMSEEDVFQTQDLYEAKSIYTVINCLYNLGSLARKNGYTGPTLGVKLAEKNTRQFSEETLVEGRKTIGLQYGSNKGPSQSGMKPYGSTRRM